MDAHPVELLKFLFSKACFNTHANQPSVFLSRWFDGDVKKLHINTNLVVFFPHGLEPLVRDLRFKPLVTFLQRLVRDNPLAYHVLQRNLQLKSDVVFAPIMHQQLVDLSHKALNANVRTSCTIKAHVHVSDLVWGCSTKTSSRHQLPPIRSEDIGKIFP